MYCGFVMFCSRVPYSVNTCFSVVSTRSLVRLFFLSIDISAPSRTSVSFDAVTRIVFSTGNATVLSFGAVIETRNGRSATSSSEKTRT